MKRKLLLSFTLLLTLFVGSSCDENGEVHLFSIEKDIDLGKQVAEEIANNPSEYPILKEGEYPEAYSYLRGILAEVLESDDIKYKDKFAYEQIKIINKDDVLNAFCTPGGYIYVYTGLIKYLDSEDHLAGVIGHEIAHAEKRHSIDQLERSMGIQVLLDIVLGQDRGQIADVLAGVVSLKFSRNQEAEADEFSVKYLSPSVYQCNGAAGFFQKLLNEGQSSGTPEFLSTHPSPDSRVEDINSLATEIGCNKSPSEIDYQTFKSMLPQQ
ncbi:M48 family metalloprotease [Limibacter armeniacum]|uniref:M48 family metalloprotease n=1 Tax=Limibacter armeniacum TaxID=466084 RepID=UPI002FE6730A